MSLTKFIPVTDDCFVNVDFHQVIEDSFIPIVNIGGSVHGKYKKRPKEMYIRATHEVLSDIFKSEANKERFFKWLHFAVLNGLDKEKQ